MTQELGILLITAVSVAFLHTLFGPDHYVPFIVMSKAGKWSTIKTTWITILCGIGQCRQFDHSRFRRHWIRHRCRTSTVDRVHPRKHAGWILIAFGLIYSIWGLRRAYRNQPHTHWHPHSDGHVQIIRMYIRKNIRTCTRKPRVPA